MIRRRLLRATALAAAAIGAAWWLLSDGLSAVERLSGSTRPLGPAKVTANISQIAAG